MYMYSCNVCVVVLLCFLSACSRSTVTQDSSRASLLVDSCTNFLKSGDVVLRSGKSFTSKLLSSFNTKNNTYSHVGVVVLEQGTPYVYHAIGGEDNPNATIRKESLQSWCNPLYNSGFAVVRYGMDSAEINCFVDVVKEYYNQHLKFDMDFSLATDSTMYCTEMVYKAIAIAQEDNNWLIPSMAANKSYIAVDDLFLHPAAKFICRVRF